MNLKEEEKELIAKLNGLFEDAKKKHDLIQGTVNNNQRMYLGIHDDKQKKWTDYQSKTVINKEFMMVETITPIMTDRQPILEARYADPKEQAIKQAEKIEKALKYHCRRLKFDLLSPKIVRKMLKYRDAFIKPCWDYYEDDVDVELVDHNHLFIDPNATSTDDADYFVLSIPRSKRWLKQKFSNKTKEIDEMWHTEKDENEEDENKNQMNVKEFWGWVQSKEGDQESYDIWVIYWVGNLLLIKEKNPYWDFEGELQGEQPELGMEELLQEDQSEENIKHFNQFKRQKLPLIRFETFNEGKDIYSETSLIEQTKKLQLSINKRKRQIDENANLMANGQWVVGLAAGVDKNLLTNQPGLVVMAEDPNLVRREPGVPLPSYVVTDLEHSEKEFDNVSGVHDITRGERSQQKTATESTLLKDADQGRIALLIRNFNEGIRQLGEWWLHLMKVKYTRTHLITIYGTNGADEYIELSRTDIEDGIELEIKAGSNTPIDRLSQREEWKDLASRKLVTPMFLYERMGDFENAEEESIRLAEFNAGMPYQPMLKQQAQPQQIPADLPPTLEGGMPGQQMQGQEQMPQEQMQGQMPQGIPAGLPLTLQ